MAIQLIKDQDKMMKSLPLSLIPNQVSLYQLYKTIAYTDAYMLYEI